jgi:hypothetical protein
MRVAFSTKLPFTSKLKIHDAELRFHELSIVHNHDKIVFY